MGQRSSTRTAPAGFPLRWRSSRLGPSLKRRRTQPPDAPGVAWTVVLAALPTRRSPARDQAVLWRSRHLKSNTAGRNLLPMGRPFRFHGTSSCQGGNAQHDVRRGCPLETRPARGCPTSPLHPQVSPKRACTPARDRAVRWRFRNPESNTLGLHLGRWDAQPASMGHAHGRGGDTSTSPLRFPTTQPHVGRGCPLQTPAGTWTSVDGSNPAIRGHLKIGHSRRPETGVESPLHGIRCWQPGPHPGAPVCAACA